MAISHTVFQSWRCVILLATWCRVSRGQCSKSWVEDCSQTGCCIEPNFQCFRQGTYWSGCMASCDRSSGWACDIVRPAVFATTTTYTTEGKAAPGLTLPEHDTEHRGSGDNVAGKTTSTTVYPIPESSEHTSCNGGVGDCDKHPATSSSVGTQSNFSLRDQLKPSSSVLAGALDTVSSGLDARSYSTSSSSLTSSSSSRSTTTHPSSSQTSSTSSGITTTHASKTVTQTTHRIDESMIVIDIFRAMKGSLVDSHVLEDDDAADLSGVLKYIHTECIMEHLLPPLRQSRKYEIDSISKRRVKIRNPTKLLHSASKLKNDFGQFITYDHGVATNTAQLSIMQEYGDFVGIHDNRDPRYPSLLPYYWFSLGNRCPNLPWQEKTIGNGSNPKCLKHKDGGSLQGGLCPFGVDQQHELPEANPTGEQGCVYTYGKANVVSLDVLVGITHEDCGWRACTSWLDFRQHCTARQYKRKFDAASGNIIDVDYCVEYDIHPKCEPGCGSELCRALLANGSEVELGLSFWSGRCDPRANQRRSQSFATAISIPRASLGHQLYDDTLLQMQFPCAQSGNLRCKPHGDGGPYCSRSFSGVCEQCYIPGTKRGPHRAAGKPWCPYDILHNAEYRISANESSFECGSKRPRDHCCIYSSNCEGAADPFKAPLDDDGLALVASLMNTTAMVTFLLRAALQNLSQREVVTVVSGNFNLTDVAYWQWSLGPTGRNFSDAMVELKDALRIQPTTSFGPPGIAKPWGKAMSPGQDAIIFRKFLAGGLDEPLRPQRFHAPFILVASLAGTVVLCLLSVLHRRRQPREAGYRALQFAILPEGVVGPVAVSAVRSLLPQRPALAQHIDLSTVA